MEHYKVRWQQQQQEEQKQQQTPEEVRRLGLHQDGLEKEMGHLQLLVAQQYEQTQLQHQHLLASQATNGETLAVAQASQKRTAETLQGLSGVQQQNVTRCTGLGMKLHILNEDLQASKRKRRADSASTAAGTR